MEENNQPSERNLARCHKCGSSNKLVEPNIEWSRYVRLTFNCAQDKTSSSSSLSPSYIPSIFIFILNKFENVHELLD